jgi:hypothetical protein
VFQHVFDLIIISRKLCRQAEAQQQLLEKCHLNRRKNVNICKMQPVHRKNA